MQGYMKETTMYTSLGQGAASYSIGFWDYKHFNLRQVIDILEPRLESATSSNWRLIGAFW